MANMVARYREEGCRRFQLKVGGDPEINVERVQTVLSVLKPGDISVVDANTGWLPHQAIRVVNRLAGRDVCIEVPCVTYEECLTVRRDTALPMVFEGLITGVTPFVRAYHDGAMEVINIKISRVGGLTNALQLCNLCESLGIMMTIEDSWGGDITIASIAALAGSTRPEYLFASTDFKSYIDVTLAHDAPRREDGRLVVPTEPGLGIIVNEQLLGAPLLTLE